MKADFDSAGASAQAVQILTSSRSVQHAAARIAEQLSDLGTESNEFFCWKAYSRGYLQRYFSWKRHLVVRVFPLPTNASVIEAHAGAGAITRYLGETFRSVIAFEEDPDLAVAAAQRCRGLSNIKIIRGAPTPDASQCEIGVLVVDPYEYASKKRGLAELEQTLKTVAGLLGPGGILIFAVENRNGLRNLETKSAPLPGAPVFENPENAPRLDSSQVAKWLCRVGFPAIQTVFAYPDHVTPAVFLTPEASNRKLVSLGCWAALDGLGVVPGSVSNEGSDLVLGIKLAQGGLLGQLANSFVVLAARSAADLPRIPWQVLSLSGERRPAFARTRTFIKAGDSSMQVHKEGVPRKGEIFSFQPNLTGPLFEGRTLLLQMVENIRASNKPGFYGDLGKYIRLVHEKYGLPGVSNIPLLTCPGDILVSGEAFDLLPRNIVNQNATLCPFDLEWICNYPVLLSFLLFRSLLYLREWIEPTEILQRLELPQSPDLNWLDAVLAMIHNIKGLEPITRKHLAFFREFEDAFFAFVSEGRVACEKSLMDLYQRIYLCQNAEEQRAVLAGLQQAFPEAEEVRRLAEALK